MCFDFEYIDVTEFFISFVGIWWEEKSSFSNAWMCVLLCVNCGKVDNCERVNHSLFLGLVLCDENMKFWL